ncbi:hypothetical protein QTP88_029151 [Uroleucon formosanum]
MAKSIPESWDMDQDPTKNPKLKRKGSSSPTQASNTKKKPAKTPSVPTNIDSDSLLSAAANATKPGMQGTVPTVQRTERRITQRQQKKSGRRDQHRKRTTKSAAAPNSTSHRQKPDDEIGQIRVTKQERQE